MIALYAANLQFLKVVIELLLLFLDVNYKGGIVFLELH